MFEESRKRVFDVTQEELEHHLKKTYTDLKKDEEMELIDRLEQITVADIPFDLPEP